MLRISLPDLRILALGLMLFLGAAAAEAENIDFTVNTSEVAVVSGNPRITINVGGADRYATYFSGSGTQQLTFRYQVQPGDFDMNGITFPTSPSIDLNTGSITDAALNPLSSLAFTAPATQNVKVQTFTAAFVTSPVTSANSNAISISILKAPIGGSFTYTISSSGGGSVSGTSTIASQPHIVSGIDVSGLPVGTLTLSVTITTNQQGSGTAQPVTTTPVLTSDLDGINKGDAAYSTRRMFSSYTGPLLRVRRSSNNAQQDIIATIGGGLYIPALTSFCGSSSCFVTTWYDQSGSARDVSQANTIRQPRLVNAGTIETLNGLPSLWYDGSGMLLVNSSLMPTGNSVWSTHLIDVLGFGGGGRGRVWGLNQTPSFSSTIAVANTTDNDNYFGPGTSITSLTNITPRITSLAAAPGTATIWANGAVSKNVTSPTITTGWTGGEPLAIGNVVDFTNFGRSFGGRINTVVIGVGATSSANRQTLERWLGNLAGISVP